MQKHELFEFLNKSNLIPKPSTEISDIFEMLNNPVDLDIDLLVEKINKVDKLNELMIKNLNTGYFRTNRKISSIREAIVYLGMQTVQNLLTFFITLQLFSNTQTSNNIKRVFDIDQYLKHVLGTSVASSMLASKVKIGDQYKLFSYGLVHDIGIAVLDTCMPDILDEITQKLKKGVHQVVAERSLLGGVTHAEVGAWLCRKWNIRNDIIDIVEFHHTPFLAEMTTDELKIIHIADVISTIYYEKLLGVNLHHSLNNKLMESLGITEEHVKSIAAELPQEVDKLNYYFILE